MRLAFDAMRRDFGLRVSTRRVHGVMLRSAIVRCTRVRRIPMKVTSFNPAFAHRTQQMQRSSSWTYSRFFFFRDPVDPRHIGPVEGFRVCRRSGT